MLKFQQENYVIKKIEYDGKEFFYRAFEKIQYIKNPTALDIQVMNIYVPELYYSNKMNMQEEGAQKYSLKTAPIFLPNLVGGYMPGGVGEVGIEADGQPNAILKALLHGYVVASPGLRGRTMQNEKGEYIGVAPAAICDYKAAVRYLRYNAEVIPGNTERIISNGTSAGGAMSALLGATGNHPDYEGYLEEMGAAKERDDIFFASCYCPITNLEHADMAYEWEFFGLKEFHQMEYIAPESSEKEGKWVPVVKEMTEEQMQLSAELKKQFPKYVEGLQLKALDGKALTLEEDSGSLLDLVCHYVMKSAQTALQQGTDLSDINWLTIDKKKVLDMDYRKYIEYRTRMKDTPAFDKLTLVTPENELFGSKNIEKRHFTEFSLQKDCNTSGMAENEQIKLMNPMNYIDDTKATKAQYFWIRHGAVDRDTSLFIPMMLAVKLWNQGIAADLSFPWGKWHMGDYDLDEVFEKVDELCGIRN